MAKLSELEGCVLGLVETQGPLTPYAVRKVFLDSASPHWSGSAGAIYPLIRRLEERALLKSEAHRTGSRRSRLYRSTATGRRVLRRWVGPPIPDWVVAVPVDSLRTRLSFLVVLSRADRIAFVTNATRMIEAHIRTVREHPRAARPEPFEELVDRGVLIMLEARRTWLGEVTTALKRRG